MPMQFDRETEEKQREYELQRLTAVERERAAIRRHEEEKIRLKAELAAKSKRSVTRLEVLQRVLIAIVKLITIPFAMALIWAYIRRDKDVPQFVIDYISL